ncbi:MAG: hemerythrin superfamily protein [Bradymonadia bacterium]|jgi:hemerythrin superfamily protein
MDIYTRLIRDHDEHRVLAEELIEATAPQARLRLFERLRTDVEAHANAEEQTFYAALLADADVQETARHGIVEHEELEELFESAASVGPQSDDWPAAIETLVDRLKHHMHDEEDDVFPEARQVLTDEAAIAMVQVFEDRKDGELPEPNASAFTGDESGRFGAQSV